MEAVIVNKAPIVEIEKANDTNELKLSGSIINKYETDKVIILSIGINEVHRGKIYSNYPTVYFYKEDNTGAENFLLHEKVDILAAAVSAKKVRDNGSEYKRQGLCGMQIKKAGELFPRHRAWFDKEKQKRFSIGTNTYKAVGIVRSVAQLNDGVYDYAVQTMRQGKVNFIHMTQFSKNPPKIQAGTKVIVTASIATKRKQYENFNHTFQSIVVRSIKEIKNVDTAEKAEKEA